MAGQYTSTSPYFETGYSQCYLDVMVNRPIPKENDDISFTINATYQYRPDLLAFDLYGTGNLWWVFYQRNPNTLTAPPLDFTVGKQIFLPKGDVLKQVLGY
jgi:alpha-L-fucosidase